MKTLRHHAQDENFHHVRFFYAAAMPKTLKRMAATPFAVCTVSRSKIEVGNFEVSFGSAVDYETFPGQEYIRTENLKEPYLCVELFI